MAATITAVWKGDGFLEDSDPDTKTNDPIPSGGTFETTPERLKAMQAQGRAVEALAQPAIKLPNKTTGKQE